MNLLNQVLLVVHFMWAVWMVTGVVLSVLGLRFQRFLRFRVMRTAHLAGLLATATVPLWNRGICPLTEWEWLVGGDPAGDRSSFVIRLLHNLLYLDVSPTVLTVLTALGAAITLGVYVWYPPWKYPRRNPESSADGCDAMTDRPAGL